MYIYDVLHPRWSAVIDSFCAFCSSCGLCIILRRNAQMSSTSQNTVEKENRIIIQTMYLVLFAMNLAPIFVTVQLYSLYVYESMSQYYLCPTNRCHIVSIEFITSGCCLIVSYFHYNVRIHYSAV